MKKFHEFESKWFKQNTTGGKYTLLNYAFKRENRVYASNANVLITSTNTDVYPSYPHSTTSEKLNIENSTVLEVNGNRLWNLYENLSDQIRGFTKLHTDYDNFITFVDSIKKTDTLRINFEVRYDGVYFNNVLLCETPFSLLYKTKFDRLNLLNVLKVKTYKAPPFFNDIEITVNSDTNLMHISGESDGFRREIFILGMR